MIEFEFVENFIKANFDNVKVRRNRINCRCRFCGDSKISLSKARFNLTFYNSEKIIYHCFNCEVSGSFTKLYALVKNITLDQAKIELGLNSFSSVRDMVNGKAKVEEEAVPGFHNYILVDCIPEENKEEGGIIGIYKKALLDFKKSRHIPENIRLYVAYKGKYAKRIIIPVFDEDDNIIYFQGRALSPKADRKYLNPVAEKSIIIPNLRSLESPVIITEGLLDSLMLGVHGTCCFGAHISEEFIERIKDKKLIVALDNDEAGYRSLRDFLSLNKYSGSVKYFLMPEKFKEIKDLNELKITYFNIDVLNFVLEHSYSKLQTEVKLKFDTWRKF